MFFISFDIRGMDVFPINPAQWGHAKKNRSMYGEPCNENKFMDTGNGIGDSCVWNCCGGLYPEFWYDNTISDYNGCNNTGSSAGADFCLSDLCGNTLGNT